MGGGRFRHGGTRGLFAILGPSAALMDRCSECLLEFVDAGLLTGDDDELRPDWYQFIFEHAEPAVTIFRGCGLCIKHALSALQDAL